MIEILIGTDRVDSKSAAVAKVVESILSVKGEVVSRLDLREVMPGLSSGSQYGAISNPTLQAAVDRVAKARGIVVVVPEYNGSYPGALKLFIDHWKYPESFEHRPVAFIGLGGRFGGLRPVEHLQQVFGYRNAFIYPDRVFMMNVWDHFKKTDQNPTGELKDQGHLDLLTKQLTGFAQFIKALEVSGLHCLTKR